SDVCSSDLDFRDCPSRGRESEHAKRFAVRCGAPHDLQNAPSLCKPPVTERYVQRSVGLKAGQEGRPGICIGVNNEVVRRVRPNKRLRSYSDSCCSLKCASSAAQYWCSACSS